MQGMKSQPIQVSSFNQTINFLLYEGKLLSLESMILPYSIPLYHTSPAIQRAGSWQLQTPGGDGSVHHQKTFSTTEKVCSTKVTVQEGNDSLHFPSIVHKVVIGDSMSYLSIDG